MLCFLSTAKKLMKRYLVAVVSAMVLCCFGTGVNAQQKEEKRSEPTMQETISYLKKMFTDYGISEIQTAFVANASFTIDIGCTVQTMSIGAIKKSEHEFEAKMLNYAGGYEDDNPYVKLETKGNKIRRKPWVYDKRTDEWKIWPQEERTDGIEIYFDKSRYKVGVATRVAKAFSHLAKLCSEDTRPKLKDDNDPFK